MHGAARCEPRRKYISPARARPDAPDEPEAFLYEKRNNGTYKLTGFEYVVAGGPRPTLFGRAFDETNLARYGNPAATVWTLHAWVWKGNPDGVLEPWNPTVSCD